MATVACSKCGRLVRPEHTACPACGTPVASRPAPGRGQTVTGGLRPAPAPLATPAAPANPGRQRPRSRRLRVLAVAAALVLVVGGIAVAGLLLTGRSTNRLTPEEQVTADALEGFERRMDGRVWSQIEAQAWFDGGRTTADGLRLLGVMANSFRSLRYGQVAQLLGLYPAGLSEVQEQQLAALASSSALQAVLFSPWFADGVDEHERQYLGFVVAATGRNWTFDEYLLAAATKVWFKDGIDEKEIAVLGAGAALSTRNRMKAEELINGLDSNLFLYEKADLPVSGEKVLLVTATTRDLEARLRPALELVKQWMAQVEAFAGAYTPQHIVVSVAELSGARCGTGSGQDEDVPGVITLHLECIQDRTVIHELAHIFVGTGPTWFTEGFADLIVYHITGRMGSYLGRPSSGRIEIAFRQGPGGVGSPEYANQGSLGAKYLLEVYRLLGQQQMSAALQQMMTVEWPRDGRALLDVLAANTRDDFKPRLTALTTERFE